MAPNPVEESPVAVAAPRVPWLKWAIGVGFLLILGLAYVLFADSLTLTELAKRETGLRQFQANHAVLVFGVAFVVYVTVTGLSLPGATPLSLLYAWYFGFFPAVVLVSLASTSGATLAFLLSRFLFREGIQRRFGTRLASFNESLDRDGPFFLFTLRLIPAVPFFVINAVMGLTPIRTWTFWWVSQLGMLPGTLVYVYAGSSVPNLDTLAKNGIRAVFDSTQLLQILLAFGLLGVFPLIVRWGVNRWSQTNSDSRRSGDSKQS